MDDNIYPSEKIAIHNKFAFLFIICQVVIVLQYLELIKMFNS